MSTYAHPQEAPELSLFDYLGTLVEDESGWMDPLLLEQDEQQPVEETQPDKTDTQPSDTEATPTVEVSP